MTGGFSICLGFSTYKSMGSPHLHCNCSNSTVYAGCSLRYARIGCSGLRLVPFSDGVDQSSFTPIKRPSAGSAIGGNARINCAEAICTTSGKKKRRNFGMNRNDRHRRYIHCPPTKKVAARVPGESLSRLARHSLNQTVLFTGLLRNPLRASRVSLRCRRQPGCSHLLPRLFPLCCWARHLTVCNGNEGAGGPYPELRAQPERNPEPWKQR